MFRMKTLIISMAILSFALLASGSLIGDTVGGVVGDTKLVLPTKEVLETLDPITKSLRDTTINTINNVLDPLNGDPLINAVQYALNGLFNAFFSFFVQFNTQKPDADGFIVSTAALLRKLVENAPPPIKKDVEIVIQLYESVLDGIAPIFYGLPALARGDERQLALANANFPSKLDDFIVKLQRSIPQLLDL